MTEKYKPLADVVKQLVEGEDQELEKTMAETEQSAQGKLAAGLSPDEAEYQKSLLNATKAAQHILSFIPRYYGKEE